jgi:hypothetical protein
MHVLYGLKKQGFEFELKGGTSLSKGYKIISRFSEDIDIHIKPPKDFDINENPKNTNPKNVTLRKNFYDWLADKIKIDGIVSVKRDIDFDDKEYYRSGGIRLFYESKSTKLEDIKDGILLEAGFDKINPNNQITISSWALDRSAEIGDINIIDNRAIDVTCYHPGYTFVEKLQTIATKYRIEQESSKITVNFMRQYYDIYCLLDNERVQNFIGTEEYIQHKQNRFPKKDYIIPVAENEAFLLSDTNIRASFEKRYRDTASLYYQGQPSFTTIIEKIQQELHKL